ncbi:MAG: hypothetical protein ACFFAU_15275, partial [Candidatus Hodarchaeota archaeon]
FWINILTWYYIFSNNPFLTIYISLCCKTCLNLMDFIDYLILGKIKGTRNFSKAHFNKISLNETVH